MVAEAPSSCFTCLVICRLLSCWPNSVSSLFDRDGGGGRLYGEKVIRWKYVGKTLDYKVMDTQYCDFCVTNISKANKIGVHVQKAENSRLYRV